MSTLVQTVNGEMKHISPSQQDTGHGPYGCNNSTPAPDYLVPVRDTRPLEFISGRADSRRDGVYHYAAVVNTMSRTCKYDFKHHDPRCKGCMK